MMDRKVQRELVKSMLILIDTMRKIDWTIEEQRRSVLEILYAVEKQCEGNLSATRYAYYQDVIQGLFNIIATAPWGAMGAGDIIDACHLSQDILHSLIKALREEKEIKKEIVFLPYKASMWDSLESVWKAAVEDKEHCNTYVIPIPYYDRNPDGSFGMTHYEGLDFPADIPIINYLEYDFEMEHPDLIFVHNAYDRDNLATSVYPQFYSDNLRKWTTRLIYIPYFILEDRDYTNDEEAVKYFFGLISHQSMVNFDDIVVQSENLRQLYIEVLTRNSNTPNTERQVREYWSKKVKALGSPKLDKLNYMKHRECRIPKEWELRIEGKKVVLYNTSLNVALKNIDKLCGKMRSVFKQLLKIDDIVIWWRPHPLMKTILHSSLDVSLEVENEYREIEQQYIKEDWGIYDDTPELERAIVYSTIYYGDPSSVVELYKETGKFIVIEDFNIQD